MLLTPTAFRLTYRDDPVAFAHDCISEPLTEYQDEILSALATQDRVAVRAPHGAGKSAIASVAAWWFALTRDDDDWKLPTTASAWIQLEKFLWPEIHLWSRRIDWGRVGRLAPGRDELLNLALKLKRGQAFAIASDDPGRMEGAHAKRILYVFDEAKTIPTKTWDAADGAFSTGKLRGGEARALAISTPGAAVGRFWQIHSEREKYKAWWVRHVTLDEAIKAGRIDPLWVEEKKREWDESSVAFRNRVLGEFVPLSDSQVFRGLERCAVVRDWQEPRAGEQYTIGVDLARVDDYTVLTVMNRLREVCFVDRFTDVAWSVQRDRISALAGRYGRARVFVDGTGIGDPIVEDLQRAGLDCNPVKIGAYTGRIATAKTELIEYLAMEIDRANIAIPVPDKFPAMIEELAAFTYSRSESGRLTMEGRDGIHDDCVISLALAAWGWKNSCASQKVQFIMPKVQTVARWK